MHCNMCVPCLNRYFCTEAKPVVSCRNSYFVHNYSATLSSITQMRHVYVQRSAQTWTWAARLGHLWCPLQETGVKVLCHLCSSTSEDTLSLLPGLMLSGSPWNLLPNTQSLWIPPTEAKNQNETRLSTFIIYPVFNQKKVIPITFLKIVTKKCAMYNFYI